MKAAFSTQKYQYYQPPVPSLTTASTGPLRLGVHCRGFKTLGLIQQARLPINLIEVKPDYFRGDEALFVCHDQHYSIQRANFSRLVTEARALGLAIQFHFPEVLSGINLTPGLPAAHQPMLSLLAAIAEAVTDFQLEPVVTLHPPTLYWRDRQMLPNSPEAIDGALAAANVFLRQFGQAAEAKSWPLLLGIENQAGPTPRTHALGYQLRHFEIMLAGTSSRVNLTIDSGHRLLAEDMTLSRHFLPLAQRLNKRVVDLHLHENAGRQADEDRSDQHNLPLGEHIHGYLKYLCRAVGERIPIILEVDPEKYNPTTYLLVTMGIRALMERMEEERAAQAA